mmetsp:Transcript_33911/g.49650  ORF Transcript_33911/g.49650 Transcript_33911/m.49650 type:complete len:93 (-) Transcript_33911:484-762(-)
MFLQNVHYIDIFTDGVTVKQNCVRQERCLLAEENQANNLLHVKMEENSFFFLPAIGELMTCIKIFIFQSQICELYSVPIPSMLRIWFLHGAR